MSMQSFFNYPTEPDQPEDDDLVFLSQWDEDKWSRFLGYVTRLRFEPGDVVISIGDTDRSVYIITEGSLEILIPQKGSQRLQRTQVRHDGSVIGEQAFIDAKPRSATVRAVTKGEMLRLDVTTFEVLAAREPEMARAILFEIARILSVKLRQANLFISRWVK